jgi:hypothetical protein
MGDRFVIEQGEDFDKEMTFDKFMDEIEKSEQDKNRIVESDGEGEYGRKISDRYRERPGNRTKYGRR